MCWKAIANNGSQPEDAPAIIDIVPGGNKELVLLDEYYISNGDNSDLIIYEIKTI